MLNMIVAYLLIAVVLIGYGAYLYRRMHAAEKALQAFDEK